MSESVSVDAYVSASVSVCEYCNRVYMSASAFVSVVWCGVVWCGVVWCGD